MEVLLGLLAGIGGILLYLIKQNQKLESDQKLHKIEVEDAKLETKEEDLKKQKNELKRELSEAEKEQVKDLSDEQIEEFWRKRK